MRISAPLAIVLDATPLSLLAHRPGHAGGDACRSWFRNLVFVGCRFFVPEIADYETRREFIRSANQDAIARLDAFIYDQPDRYLSLTTPTVRLAAELWGQVR